VALRSAWNNIDTHTYCWRKKENQFWISIRAHQPEAKSIRVGCIRHFCSSACLQFLYFIYFSTQALSLQRPSLCALRIDRQGDGQTQHNTRALTTCERKTRQRDARDKHNSRVNTKRERGSLIWVSRAQANAESNTSGVIYTTFLLRWPTNK
jgi:hypothetical protein